MTRAEIFENRREVGKKLCEQIRQSDGQIINSKNFLEPPHYDVEKKYKFSTANYLRLMSAEKILAGIFLWRLFALEIFNFRKSF